MGGGEGRGLASSDHPAEEAVGLQALGGQEGHFRGWNPVLRWSACCLVTLDTPPLPRSDHWALSLLDVGARGVRCPGRVRQGPPPVA